jgi:hypothetical protein
MKAFAFAGVVAVVLAGGSVGQEPPKMPKPEKEHEWLRQLEGEWVTDAEAQMAPGQPAMKCKGTDATRSLGGFWTVTEIKAEVFGTSMTGLLTIGYDPRKQKYVGTWVCSAEGKLWQYEGTVSGKTLTLETEGPSPVDPTKTVKMRDVIELKDKDHKVMTSSALGDDGKWTTFMTMNARRKK